MKFKTKESKQKFLQLALNKGVKQAKREMIKGSEIPLFVDKNEPIETSEVEFTSDEVKKFSPEMKVY